MPRRKIAFIHPDLGIGGAERLILDVAGALSNQGNDVIFITNHFNKNHAFEELKDGAYPVQVIGDWIPRSICGRFQALCAYIRMIYLTIVYILFYRQEDKPDLYFIDLIPIAIPFLKMANEKTIYYCHHPDLLASAPGGVLKRFYRKPINLLELKATARADVLLVNSNYTASVFRKTFPEITRPIKVVYPTIAYSYQEAVKNMKNPRLMNQIIPEISSEQLVFLSLNRFHPAKKLDLAILAMDQLKQLTSKEQWRGIFFVIAGGYDPLSPINASYFDELQQLVKEKGLENKILFLKSPSDELKTELLLSCDCVVYTPVNEHFGIVPLEAMAACKPVIACNSGGPRETVDHGNTGYLCDSTAGSMAQFMYKILDKPHAKEMGLRGKKNLKERFSYESFCHSLERVIDVNKKQL